jgi:ferredoxin
MPSDLLPGAKSVIVVALHLLEGSIDDAGRPPARKIGHFHSAVHEEAFNQLSTVLLVLAKFLDARGMKSAPSRDLCNLASRVAGGGEDLTACRFAAVAAGLGEIGWNGIVLTPQFGARQRFAVLVTDAELEYDEVYAGPALCTGCRECVRACPIAAIDPAEKVAVTIGGRRFEWGRLDRIHCDCAQRYQFVAAEGPAYIGGRNDCPLPEKVTREWLREAFRGRDRIQRPAYTPTVEGCFTRCRAHLAKAAEPSRVGGPAAPRRC